MTDAEPISSPHPDIKTAIIPDENRITVANSTRKEILENLVKDTDHLFFNFGHSATLYSKGSGWFNDKWIYLVNDKEMCSLIPINDLLENPQFTENTHARQLILNQTRRELGGSAICELARYAKDILNPSASENFKKRMITGFNVLNQNLSPNESLIFEAVKNFIDEAKKRGVDLEQHQYFYQEVQDRLNDFGAYKKIKEKIEEPKPKDEGLQ